MKSGPGHGWRHRDLGSQHFRMKAVGALFLGMSLLISTGAANIAALLEERDIPPGTLGELCGWHLTWRPENGGHLSGIGRLAAAAEPGLFIRGFAAEHARLLGASASEIAETDTRQAGRIKHRFYQQTYAGLPVEGTQLCFSFGLGNHLLGFTARTAPGLACPHVTPRIGAAQAQHLALGDLPPAATVAWPESELAILPARFSGLIGDRLIWRLRCRTESPRGGWRIFVDAQSGEILMRRSLIYYSLTTGSVVSEILHPSPWGSATTVGLPHLSVELREGEIPVATGHTDAAGYFSFDAPPEGLTLAATLAGHYAQIHEDSLAAPSPHLALPIAATPFELIWEDAAASPAAREAYVHVNRAHDWLTRIDPGFAALDQPIPVLVNDPLISCNAYAMTDPEAPYLAFAAESGTCTATARIADVVYHEYGHLATLFAYYPAYAPADLHEGFSDYFAATLNDSSIIGLDFKGPGTSLRDVSHDMVFPGPTNCEFNEYCRGLFIAGALWDLRTALSDAMADRAAAIALADSLFHFARAGKPQTLDECLHHVLLQDDDDGNLANGTPHLDFIGPAFERHNIGDFTIDIDHSPLPDLEETTATVLAQAYISSVYPLLPASPTLHLRVDGAEFATIALEPIAASPNLYSATLPAQSAGTTVSYYLSAEDESARTALSPPGAPDTTWSYFVGVDQAAPVIVHEIAPGPVDGQARLWLAAEVTDNTGQIDSVHYDMTIYRNGTLAHSGGILLPKAPLLNSSLYEAELGLGSISPGDYIQYQFTAWDGAREPNVSTYPVDLPIILPVRRGFCWDFTTAPEGVALDGDWEWGLPQVGPGAGKSGLGAAGVALSGTYSQNLQSHLTLVDLDLSDWDAAMLNFAIWYQTEPAWDGAWIEGSRNGGQNWETLTPIGGYPDEITFGGRDRQAGFTGQSEGWQTYTIPLDEYVSETALVRFVFWSDELVTDIGCFLDNIRVAEEQALIPIEELSATRGEDGLVRLAWSAPPRTNTSAESFLGYRLYRSTIPSDPDAAILTPPDQYARTWSDVQVVNGTRYYYGVSAHYLTGESERSPEAMGFPYRAAIEVATEFAITLSDSATSNDTLWIANAGTGELHLDLYQADREETWTDLLPRANASGAGIMPFVVIGQDEADAAPPDMEYLAYQVINGNLMLRIGLYDPLPDPETAFTLEILLDTDLSRATGYPGPNAGAEYIVIMGAEARALTGQVAYLLDGERTPIEPASNVILRAGLDSLEVSVRVTTLGQPAEMGIAVTVRQHTDPPTDGDQIPNRPTSTWLTLGTHVGLATPEAPLPVPLAFDFSGYASGDYGAKLILQSNDPDQRLSEVGIAALLHEQLPPALASWSTSSLPDGLELTWRLVDPQGYVGFYLRRWSGALTDESAAFEIETLILPEAAETYRYVDRRALSEIAHFYRLIGLTSSGATDELAPPLRVTYAPELPHQLVFDPPFPNPFRSETILRIQAPEGGPWDLMVYDIVGRRIRTLMGTADSQPGVHQIVWNGRGDAGRRVGQGIYFARARLGGAERIHRITLIR